MGFYYGGKYYCSNKAYKYVTRKAKKEHKKAAEELTGMLTLATLPITLPLLAISAIFGKKKK